MNPNDRQTNDSDGGTTQRLKATSRFGVTRSNSVIRASPSIAKSSPRPSPSDMVASKALLRSFTGGGDIYQMISNGQRSGPLSKEALAAKLNAEFDALLDVTTNVLSIRHPGQRTIIIKRLGHDRGRRNLTSEVEIVRVMAENPGQLFSDAIMEVSTGRFIGADTFRKYICSIRRILGDARPFRFILTNEAADTSVSSRGSAYYANPDLNWVVVRYDPSVVSP